MEAIFGWAPLVWVVRWGILCVVVALLWIGALNFVRFVRPKHIKQLALGKLPDVRSMEFLGQKVELNSETTGVLSDQIKSVEERLTHLEQQHDELAARTES